MPKANPKGNPNPSPDTRFGGARGNPNGKTSEQKRLEIENAERAVRIRSRGLMAIEAMLEGMDDQQVAGLILDAQALKLLKDSEDRGLGAPKQSVDVSGEISEELRAWLGKS